jgi:hypothetical protein
VVSRSSHARAVLAALVLVTILVAALTVSTPSLANERVARPAPSEQAIADALEEAIRESEELSLLTKLSIQSRYDTVTKAAERFKRGQIPEYDLRVIFETAVRWLERTVAANDPALHVQLVQARPVLWKLALAQ